MSKKKFYKNGNPEVFRYFTEATLKNMTENEKAMWTEHSQDDPAPIPADVIEFQEKHKEQTEKVVSLSDALNEANKKLKEAEDVVKKLKQENAELNVKVAEYEKLVATEQEKQNEEVESDEEAAKKLIKEELRMLGVRYAHNASLERLQEQLEEAKNAND